MSLKLDRPLIHLDIESTGTDTQHDAIWQFAAIRELPDGSEQQYSTRIKPWKEIPPDVCEMCGIKNEDLVHERPFKDVASQISNFLAGADLAGFGLIHFDVSILWEELYRAGIDWDLTGVRMLDASIVYKRMEPRDLTAAMKFYCNESHGDAHEAMADTLASRKVLRAQLGSYPDFLPDSPVQAVHDFCAIDRDGSRRVDLAGVIVQDPAGVYRYTHKKVRGVAVKDDPGYGEWICRNNFSEQTIRILRKILDDIYAEFDRANEVAQGQGALL